MATLSFPSSPASGDTYTENGLSWVWDGETWNSVKNIDHGALTGLGDDDHTQYPKLTNSDTAPSSPRVNDMWYDTTNGRTYVYYDSFWVEMGSGSGEILLDNVSDVNAGSPAAGDVLAYNGTDWSTAPQLNADASIGSGSAGLFIPGAQMIGIFNGVPTSNRFYGSYMICETTTTLTLASTEVAVAAPTAGAVMRIAICSLDIEGATLNSLITWTIIHDLGTVLVDSIGIKEIDLSSDPIVLSPGIYGVLTCTSDVPTLSCNYVVYSRPIPGTFSHQSTGNRNYAQPRNTTDGSTYAVNGMPSSIGMTGAAAMGGATNALGAWVIWKGTGVLNES